MPRNHEYAACAILVRAIEICWFLANHRSAHPSLWLELGLGAGGECGTDGGRRSIIDGETSNCACTLAHLLPDVGWEEQSSSDEGRIRDTTCWPVGDSRPPAHE
jgi:hypothetical protein